MTYTPARELADRFHEEWLAANPFEASYMGVLGWDDRVPDASEEGEETRRGRLADLGVQARGLLSRDPGDDDRLTLQCLDALAASESAELAAQATEHLVTPSTFHGPAQLMAVAARTIVTGPEAAGSYLERLRRSAIWLDQVTERLRQGRAKGRLPVAPLVEKTIAWAGEVLAPPVPDALVAAAPPSGWDGAEAWGRERDRVARDVVRPALVRWFDELNALLPESRPGEQAGLVHLPGGEADYRSAIKAHTTLDVTAEQLHQRGREELERLEERAVELGAKIGLTDLAAVRQALGNSAGKMPPDEAMARARRAVSRGEAHVPQLFTAPLPPPCAVEAMPPVVASSGVAPHYTPPRLDGSRPGTYWFNTQVPTAGTGWDLEAVAYHEALPGHHVQFSRLQLLTELPAMQRQRYVTVFSEGWGLFAEQLAEEHGMYSNTESLLGAVATALMRAARLVLDTGLHAFGWGRDEAVRFFEEHVPMPAEFLASEVDRYISWPGQALAYLTGKAEILHAREEVRRTLGASFSPRDFHAALLDHGSLPMPVMHEHLRRWARDQEAKKA
ncbi:MAG TPA: DUF885 domain-containing protein [Acidimicrobiales bacterium]|nr:DUF885 domain-containing protein [Acidimicrobiales bacterium]